MENKHGLKLFAVLTVLWFSPVRPLSQGAGPGIVLEPVITGLSNPVLITHAGDGSRRLFIVEQTGRIWVLQPESTAPSLFLDIGDRVRFGGERGLLGLAFHPQFASNRRFFVNYTRQGDGATVIAEYQATEGDPDVAEGRERVLLVQEQPFANHNGGMIAFGPDGYLYIGMGDGGSANDPGNRAQNIESLLGKMLRIDVDVSPGAAQPYASPADNPFAGPQAGRDEIFALGLRNPWRFSFDRLTGDLYAGDVGQNAVEEVDLIIRGGNYGWRVYEASRCTNLGPAPCVPDNFIFPITEYANAGSRCSVTGGYVYRGTGLTLPQGSYVYGDFCSGEIFLFSSGTYDLLLDTTLAISSFGEDEAGELYVADLFGGTVHRIVNPAASNLGPVYFPRLVTRELQSRGYEESEHTGLAFVNLDTSDATVRLTALDTSGSLLSGPAVTNPATIQLGAGHQSPLVDTQLFGAGLLEGSGARGWTLAESESDGLRGFFLVFDNDLTVLDGADVGSALLTEFLFPEIESDGFTEIHVANPHPEQVRLDIELIGADGVVRGATARTVEPRGALGAGVTELFPTASAGASDYLRIRSTKGVAPFQLMGRASDYFMGLNGQDADSTDSILYSPQYAVGGPVWHTSLTVINLEQVPGRVTLTLINDDGIQVGNTRSLSLAPQGKIRITDQEFFLTPGDTLTQGYLRIAGDGVRIAGSVVFGDRGTRSFASALPLSATRSGNLLFAQVASNATYYTGLAIANPGLTPVTAAIEVFDAQGNRIARADEVIGSGRRTSRLLTQYLPQLQDREIASGYFTVTVDSGVAAFAVFGTHTGSALSAVPSQRGRP